MQKPIQRVKFTKAIARHTKIRDQNPSIGYICLGEERVTAKSKPMMNLVSRYRERDPIVFASIASESPVKNQIWKSESISELVKCTANMYGETRIGRQLSKLPRMEHWRQVVFSSVEIWWNVEHKYGDTRKWQVCHRWWYGLWYRHRIELFCMITIRLRKMLDRSPGDAMQDIDKRFMIWWMFSSLTVEASVFHMKEPLRQFAFHKKHMEKSHFKADVRDIWVDIGTIWWDFWSVLKSVGKILFGNNYLWSMMKKSSVSHAKVYVFSDSVLCLGKVSQNPTSNTAWEQHLDWFTDSSQYRTLDTIDGEPMEFEWIFSQDSLHNSSSKNFKSSWTKWVNQNNSKDELSSCRWSMTSYGKLKTMKNNVLLIPHLSFQLKKISSMTLIIIRTWIRNKVVLYP